MKIAAICALAALARGQDPTPSPAATGAGQPTIEDLYRFVDWNRALAGTGDSSGRPLRLLEGLALRPVVLSESDSRSGGPTIGLQYDFQKNIAKPIALSATRGTGLVFELIGRGNLTFEKDENPNDLLETGFRLSLFGRFSPVSGKVGPLEQRARAGDAQAREQYSRLQTSCDALLAELSTADDWTYDEALKSPTFRSFLERNPEAYLGEHTWWTWHSDLKATYETNQAFTERQAAFGLRLGATGFSDDPDVMSWNVFDYPFMVSRWLTGEQDTDKSAKHFPRLGVGLDLVDPAQDGAREAAGEDLDPYTRFSAEAGFVTHFGTVGDRSLKASLGWRYFEELGASDAIEDADLDRSDYFEFAITDQESGVFFSYTTGTLPLDADDDSVFAVGWNFSH